MIWIRDCNRQRVGKHGGRLMKRNAMRPEVRVCLPFVPFKAQCHQRVFISDSAICVVRNTVQHPGSRFGPKSLPAVHAKRPAITLTSFFGIAPFGMCQFCPACPKNLRRSPLRPEGVAYEVAGFQDWPSRCKTPELPVGILVPLPTLRLFNGAGIGVLRGCKAEGRSQTLGPACPAPTRA